MKAHPVLNLSNFWANALLSIMVFHCACNPAGASSQEDCVRDMEAVAHAQTMPAREEGLPNADRTIPHDVLGKKVMAVHATMHLPKDGVLRTRSSLEALGISPPSQRSATFRPTVHWSLGSLVREHGRNSWEDSDYAVLVPLNSMKNQLVNLSAADSFTLGDYKLPPDAVVVVPKGQGHLLPKDVRVVEYERGSTTLREAIDGALKNEGAWRFDLPVDKPGPDAVVSVEGNVVNFSRMVDGFLKHNPHISEGSHTQSARGFAHRFGTIENVIGQISRQYNESGTPLSTAHLKFARMFIEDQLRRLDLELSNVNVSESGVKNVEVAKKDLEGWLNLIDADLAMRTKHALTFAGADKVDQSLIKFSKDKPEQLHRLLQSAKTERQLDPAVRGNLPLSTALDMLTSSSRSEFDWYYRRIGEQKAMNADEFARLRALYAVNRTLVIGADRAASEGLLTMIGEELRGDSSTAHRGPLMDSISDSLGQYLDLGSTGRQTALTILQMPTVQKAFETKYGIRYPEKDLSMEDFLRIHPATRNAYAGPDVSSLNPTSVMIVNKLMGNDAFAGGEAIPVTSYSQAKSISQSNSSDIDQMMLFVNALNQPMKSVHIPIRRGGRNRLHPYQLMKRGDFGSVEAIWTKLGLGKEYSRNFDSEAAFWNSGQSFVNIYSLLSNLQRSRN